MKKASLFTYRASLTLVQLTAETLLYQQMQAIFQSIQTDGINHLIDEGKHQQQTGLAHGDAALLHIEQSTFVKLPHRSAMATLHIISINLQLRLGLHVRFARSAKVAVRLLGARMLCIGTYQHQTGKSTD